MRCYAWVLLLTLPALAQSDHLYQGRPYQNKPQTLPGRLQCALFDEGGEGLAYHDTDPINHGSGELNKKPDHCEPGVPKETCYFRERDGADISYVKKLADLNHPQRVTPDYQQLYLGWTADGEWVHYTIDVKQAGLYRITALYSHQPNTVRFALDGEAAAECRLPLATGDWHNWNKAPCGEIRFRTPGRHVLTLHYNSGNNLAYFDFEPIKPEPAR